VNHNEWKSEDGCRVKIGSIGERYNGQNRERAVNPTGNEERLVADLWLRLPARSTTPFSDFRERRSL